jgi:hypothetical protein
MTVALCLLFVGLAAGPVLADVDSGRAQARSRTETRTAAQNPQGEALRQRIQQRIQDEVGLQDQERERLRINLGECNRLALDDATVAALFSEKAQLRSQIRTQERVLTLARQGMPVEPVVQKLQEGLRKGATQEARERVCEQVEAQVRTAHQYMKQAREAGIKPGDANAERKRVRDMASYMWRGLKEGDMEQLQTHAQKRLRDGSCTTEDLTAAAEAATRLGEIGVNRERAVLLAGEALQNGYTVREMRQLAWAVMTARTHGASSDNVIDTLERGIRNQHQFARMMQEMQQQGWMGPADQQGGHSPMDNSGGSGYGGRHQDGGAGGMGDADGSGSGSGPTGDGQGGQGGQGDGGTGK